MDTGWRYHSLSKTGIIYIYITILITSVFIYGEAIKEYVYLIEEGISIGMLPDELKLQITKQSVISHMRFHKSNSVSVNVPVFTTCDNGTRLCQENPDPIQNFALYYDLESCSDISVTIEIIGNETVKRYEGNIHIGNEECVLKADDRYPPSSYGYYLEKARGLQASPSDVLKEGFGSDLPVKSEMPVLKAEHPFASSPHRRKRQATVYSVELLVVIDYKIFETWYDISNGITHTLKSEDAKRNIRQYFAHVVNGMDLRYRAILDKEMEINVGLAGYVIADTATSSYWAVANSYTQTDANGRYLFDAQKMLSSFNSWIVNLDGLPAHDHAVLFTGHNLFTASSSGPVVSVTGLAFLNRICGRSSVSVVEDHGGFGSTQIATHELGHSLGASHDGDGNSCPSDGQYIMAGKSQPTSGSNRFNQWRFSTCSIQGIKDNLARIDSGSARQPRCLSNPARPVNIDEWNQLTGIHPGQLFHVDDICRQRLGTQSYICRDLVADASNICTAMWCHIPETNQCRQFTAPRGTSCGNLKWCIDGECLFDPSAPCKTDNCVFGDQPGVVYEGKTCAQLIDVSPWACYNDVLQRRCCTRCQALYTGIAGCEYGNRQTSCPAFYCDDTSSQRDLILRQCCKTCNPRITPILQSQPDCDSSGGVTSVKRQTVPPSCFDTDDMCLFNIISTPSLCVSDADTKRLCCASCYAKEAGILPDCKDSYQCQDQSLSKYADCSTRRIKEMCCLTCSRLRDQSSSASSSSVYSKFLTVVTPILILFIYNAISRLRNL